MKRWLVVTAVLALSGGPATAQAPGDELIEVPLRVENGRLMVTVDGPGGETYDFVLGLGMTFISETAATRMGEAISSLTLGGVPVVTEQAATVPDARIGGSGTPPAGILGGETLNSFDVLIDVPKARLLLKPIGRSVRWAGQALSNPVSMLIFHGVLSRIDVEMNGQVYGGLLDLAAPYMEVNDAVRTNSDLTGDVAESFRMGYSGWSDVPVRVTESPLFQGWDPQANGFVIIGAPVAYECAISISWAHAEMRTCIR